MQTTPCPICSSDVVVEDGSSEKDLVDCLNCGAELEIVSLQPLQLETLSEETPENEE